MKKIQKSTSILDCYFLATEGGCQTANNLRLLGPPARGILRKSHKPKGA